MDDERLHALREWLSSSIKRAAGGTSPPLEPPVVTRENGLVSVAKYHRDQGPAKAGSGGPFGASVADDRARWLRYQRTHWQSGAFDCPYAVRSWSAMASMAAVNCSPMLPPK
jgi:hypothetical protein